MLKTIKLIKPVAILALAGIAAMSIVACSNHKQNSPPITLQDMHLQPSVYPALRGTIASVAVLAYDQPIIVKGWGVVANLPNTGSGEMPPGIRQILGDRLLKNGIGYTSRGTGQYDPDRILNSRQVAAVYVEGAIPPLSPAGTHFDLYITALSGTSTTNLENGLLWPVPLRTHLRRITQTDPIARGMGPVFCNPFNSKGGIRVATEIIRNGRILGGGEVTESLPVILELYNPSYRISALVERIINERYGGYPAVATAENDTTIKLDIPQKYQKDPADFIRRVMALYVQSGMPGFADSQAATLIKSLRDPNAPVDQIALALEQLGRPILPLLRQYYGSPQPAVRFFTVLAGSYIGDEDAIEVLANYATDKTSAFQETAINAMSQCGDSINASLTFSKLLQSKNKRIKILAYKGLVNIHSRHIYSQAFRGKFLMNVLPVDSSSLIYATSERLPVISLIGRIPSLLPGTLYVSSNGALTVNYPLPAAPTTNSAQALKNKTAKHKTAIEGTSMPVMLYYRDPLTHKVVELKCGPQLPSVISALASAPDPFSIKFNPKQPYIALSYQRLVAMLYTLCQNGELNADFQLQRFNNSSRAMLAAMDQPRPSHSTMGNTPLATQNPQGNSTPIPAIPYKTSLPGEIPGQ